MSDKNLKSRLLEICLQRCAEKESLLHAEYRLYADSAKNETKSTAGDKHDTSKSMMQLEQEKLSAQLTEVSNLKKSLHALSHLNTEQDKVMPGSVVITGSGNFFLSVSGPAIEIGSEKYIPVSVRSPLGSLMNGKKIGESFAFNNKTFLIKAII